MIKNLLSSLISFFVVVNITFVALAADGQLLNSLANESADLTNFDAYKRELALSFAERMQDKRFQKLMRKHITDGNASASMLNLVDEYAVQSKKGNQGEFKSTLSLLDWRIREAKGIENHVDELLEVRLALPETSMKGFQGGEETLVAYVPSGDESDWLYIEAFDQNGNLHLLDPQQAPSQPVIVVGINGREDVRAGMQMVNEKLREAGLQTTGSTGFSSLGTNDVETTKLDYIRLNDDEEPWISGNAEVYAVVSGVQPSHMEAQIAVVDMPYLDKDGTNYYPNQIVLFWDQYRYAAANINLFEQDDNYNYQELIDVLLQATTSILAMFPETAPYSGLASIANKIIQALPSEWFTNSDDYVDVFYTIEKGKTYSGHYGASGNARVNLSPYILQGN